MKNRIKHYRVQKGLTQTELAQHLGTTPATVSRLETNQMTVSTEWLSRIANVLGTHPSDLVETPDRPAIHMLGSVSRNGRVSGAPDSWFLDPPSHNAVAARISGAQGLYQPGEIVIGERLSGQSLIHAVGKDCLCETAEGQLLLARVSGQPPEFTLIPAEPGTAIYYDTEVKWLAPVIYRILKTE